MQNGYVEGSKVASEGLNAADFFLPASLCHKDQSLEINYLSVLNQISLPFREICCSQASYFQGLVSSVNQLHQVITLLPAALSYPVTEYIPLLVSSCEQEENKQGEFLLFLFSASSGRSNKKIYLSILLFFPLGKVGRR